MKSFLVKAFSVCALAFGFTGLAGGGLSLVTGGWSTADQPGGVDLNVVGLTFTFLSAGLFSIGYNGLRKSFQANVAPPRQNGPS